MSIFFRKIVLVRKHFRGPSMLEKRLKFANNRRVFRFKKLETSHGTEKTNFSDPLVFPLHFQTN